LLSFVAYSQEFWTAYQNMMHGPKTVLKKEKEKTEMFVTFTVIKELVNHLQIALIEKGVVNRF
jgi:hypothetical protein